MADELRDLITADGPAGQIVGGAVAQHVRSGRFTRDELLRIAKAIRDFVDGPTLAPVPGEVRAAADCLRAMPTSKVDELARTFGLERVDRAVYFAAQHAELKRHGHCRVSEHAYISNNLAREANR